MAPAHDDFGQILDADGTVLLCLHEWGAHEHSSLTSPRRGGVVRLGQRGDLLLIGEGIETCLAAMQATGHAAWAALSTSGLRTLDLPGNVRDVIVLADGDDPGEAAAGCSMASATTAFSISGATRFFRMGLRLEISCRASSPPLS